MRVSLTTDDVDDGEDYDPDGVDKVPVQSQNLNALGMLFFHMPGNGKHEHDQQRSQAEDDVRGMQPHERIKRSTEEVRADRQSVVINQLVPLNAGPDKEDGAENPGQRPPQTEDLYLAMLDGALGEPDRQAAGEQADR